MLLATDTHYDDAAAITAGVLFDGWASSSPVRELVVRTSPVAPHEPGAFYKRELPPVLALVESIDAALETIVIDGYVWLDAEGRPGLGAFLYEALGGRVPVVGVAKTAFQGSPHAQRVFRGASSRPLFVTAVGLDARRAASLVGSMHGRHRLPTLLKRVDASSRSAPG